MRKSNFKKSLMTSFQ